MKMSARVVVASGLFVGLMVAPAAAGDRDLPTIAAQASLAGAAASADETSAPNCLLPGQLRKFGGITTVTPRRAVTLDTAECTARGGEPIESTAAAD